MISEHIQTAVERATVTLPKKKGRGVLVGGNLILTAAHCISCNCSGSMMNGQGNSQWVTHGGKRFRVAPAAIEPEGDVAVLEMVGTHDENTLKDIERFMCFCKETPPVSLYEGLPEVKEAFPVYVYNLNRTWVAGMATLCKTGASGLFVETNKPIDSGASGGPIINEAGELVGIVSVFKTIPEGSSEKCTGMFARPLLALPVWVCRRILGRDV